MAVPPDRRESLKRLHEQLTDPLESFDHDMQQGQPSNVPFPKPPLRVPLETRNFSQARNVPPGHNVQQAHNVRSGHNVPPGHHIQQAHNVHQGHNVPQPQFGMTTNSYSLKYFTTAAKNLIGASHELFGPTDSLPTNQLFPVLFGAGRHTQIVVCSLTERYEQFEQDIKSMWPVEKLLYIKVIWKMGEAEATKVTAENISAVMMMLRASPVESRMYLGAGDVV